MTTELTVREAITAIQERHIEHSTVHESKRVNLTSPFCCGANQMGATGPGLCNACPQPWPCDAARSARALQAVVEYVKDCQDVPAAGVEDAIEGAFQAGGAS